MSFAFLLASVFDTAWELITDATDLLEKLSSNWWFLLVIFAVAALDSMLPIVPSETALIVGGVAAGQGNQLLAAVILAGASGAFVGDNLAYSIGSGARNWVLHQATLHPKLSKRISWATRQIQARGGLLLVTARFIPGGRTLLTVSSGITGQPRLWFMAWTAVAATIWAVYGAVLGYVFGETFSDDHTLAFIAAFVTALSITVIIEIGRAVRGRRHSRPNEI